MEKIEQIRTELYKRLGRSAWDRGVTAYAYDLLENVEESSKAGRQLTTRREWKEAMLNGAQNWGEYSYGGCSLIYDGDIANRLCTPSELKRKRNGELNPNSRESWLDVQARALFQAQARICDILRFKLGISH